jgi:beta-glucosidase
MACVKHFAANSIENARFQVSVELDERTLRELYLPHFKACADAGAAAFMSAYNRVRGEWCGHNAYLLTDILKGEWGFDGFVMSDFIFGIRGTVDPANAGLDMEMHATQFLRAAPGGGGAGGPRAESRSTIRCAAYSGRRSDRPEEPRFQVHVRKIQDGRGRPRALSLEVARKSMVLLKNDGVPPWIGPREEDPRRGDLARLGAIGDSKGSSAGSPPTS